MKTTFCRSRGHEAQIKPESPSWGARPPRAWLAAPRGQQVARSAGRNLWNISVRPDFSARARKTAPVAGALPFCFGIWVKESETPYAVSFNGFMIKLWPRFAGAPEKFRKVLECGSPLPLLRRQSCRGESGRGLPQSKTLARQPINPIQIGGHGIINPCRDSALILADGHYRRAQRQATEKTGLLPSRTRDSVLARRGRRSAASLPCENNADFGQFCVLPSVFSLKQPKSGCKPYKIGHEPYKVGDVSYKVGHESLKIGHEPYKIGDVSYKNGRISYKVGHESYKVGRESYNVGRESYKIGHQSYKVGDELLKVSV